MLKNFSAMVQTKDVNSFWSKEWIGRYGNNIARAGWWNCASRIHKRRKICCRRSVIHIVLEVVYVWSRRRSVVCNELGVRIHLIWSLIQCEVAQTIKAATNASAHSVKVKVTAFEKLYILETTFNNFLRQASVSGRCWRIPVIPDAYLAPAYSLLDINGVIDKINNKGEA